MIKYFLPFLLIGCHPSINLHSDVALDSAFTQDQQAQIVEAIGEWKNTTDGMVDLNIIITDHPNEYGTDTMKIVMDPDASLNANGKFTYGITKFVATVSEITIYPNRIAQTPYPFKATPLHELGHSLGLVHTSQGLMTAAPTINEPDCIDDFTLKQFCGIHDCDGFKIKSDCE